VYERVPHVRVEPVGTLWAAFSPASGETLLLNDASAAVLEVLGHGPATPDAVAAALAGDSGASAADWASVLDHCWPSLIHGGLVRQR
jgi:hypothetical protein